MIDLTNLTQWYAVSIAAVTIILLSYSAGSLTTRYLYNHFKYAVLKYVVYKVLIRRRWCRGVTIFQTILLSIYIILNAVGMGIGVARINDAISRSGLLASINLVPLFLGGRTNSFAQFLGISLHSYYLLHYWLGWIAIIQGLVHTGLVCLVLFKTKTWSWNAMNASGLCIASAFALLLLSSFFFVRRTAYEMFLKLHFFIAFGAVGALLVHLLPKGVTKFIYPVAALGLWLLSTLYRVAFIIYYNSGRKLSSSQVDLIHHKELVHLRKHDEDDKDRTREIVSATTLIVYLKRPLFLRPGQYFYIFFRQLGLRRKFQSHPYMVSWWDGGAKASELHFLIEPRDGLSSLLESRTTFRSITLDGPYGMDLKLEEFESVMLFAKGIGIAGVLPFARDLTERRNHIDPEFRQGVLTRKINLVWILEENCQEEWISKHIDELKLKDPQHLILCVWCFYPKISKVEKPSNLFYRNYYGEKPLIGELIEREVNITPGRSIIAVCGEQSFNAMIRETVLGVMHASIDVSFKEVEFRPLKSKGTSWTETWAELPQPDISDLDGATPFVSSRLTKNPRLETIPEED